ncbi:MAG: anti-sigma factor [Bacteroidetes bacterium]|nr:anti-sigma factor [Bacteroidota bacterium]
MAIDAEYNDLLHAYALGCLDKEDLLNLQEYLGEGGELSWTDLGEFQNLAALLPSILNMESPSMELKDKVARKLYRIRTERRTKQAFDKPKTEEISPDQKTSGPAEKDEKLSNVFRRTKSLLEDENESSAEEPEPLEGFIQSESQHNVENFEEVSTKEKISELKRPPHETQIQGREVQGFIKKVSEEKEKVVSKEETGFTDTEKYDKEEHSSKQQKEISLTEKKHYQLHGIQETKKEKKKVGGFILTILLFLLVAAGIVFVYLKVTSEVTVYKSGIDKLNQQIKDLSAQVSDNKEIQKILQSKNVKIINLNGTEINKNGFGKLIISFENSKGFLQLSDMPALTSDNAYQLWVIINGKYASLGVIKSINDFDYFPFTIPELTNKGATKFLLSEEPAAGSLKPSTKIYLTGTLE